MIVWEKNSSAPIGVRSSLNAFGLVVISVAANAVVPVAARAAAAYDLHCFVLGDTGLHIKLLGVLDHPLAVSHH